MLRLLVFVLLLANAGYFAWTQGALAAYGFGPASQSEPQRLAQQVLPEALRILSLGEARPASSASGNAGSPPVNPAFSPPEAASPVSTTTTVAATSTAASFAVLDKSSSAASSDAAATQCLQAGVFNDTQTTALRTRLQSALPAGGWVLESALEPARWIIYMGKYTAPDALAKKKLELRQMNVAFESLTDPALDPGLSLGSFGSQADADAGLALVAQRGVKTAKVVQVQTELRGQRLKLPAVTPALRAQLETLKPQLAGKPLQVCR